MWRDHRVKSARQREKGVRSLLGWMRRDWDEMMHHCQPRPTVRTRSFNNGVQKGRWEWNHPSFTKVCSSTLLPPKGHLKYLFQKKRKKWGVFQRYAWDLLSEGNQSWKLRSFSIPHVVWYSHVHSIEKTQWMLVEILEHDELRVGGPRVKYCSREDKPHEWEW